MVFGVIVPIKGETVALTPPVPSPRRTIPSDNPRIFMDALVTNGSEVVNIAKQAQKLRLVVNQLWLVDKMIWGIDKKHMHNVL